MYYDVSHAHSEQKTVLCAAYRVILLAFPAREERNNNNNKEKKIKLIWLHFLWNNNNNSMHSTSSEPAQVIRIQRWTHATQATCGLPHINQTGDLSNTIYENDRTLASRISYAAAFHFILICRKCNKIEVQSFLVLGCDPIEILEWKKKNEWQNREQRTAHGEHFR